MEERQGPLLTVVAADAGGESVDLEELCAQELCDLTDKWLKRLPPASSLRRICAKLNGACSVFLGARHLRQIRQP